MRKFQLIVAATALAVAAFGQTSPDVIVGAITGPGNYGTDGSGIYAYSLGTDSCNLGTTPLNWISSGTGNSNQHPVIGQNIYRLKNGRFEQIGLSWLKHGFTALANNLCATCQNPGTGQLLGINCSDPYSSSLNGSQSNGPRNEVNASTGYFPIPFSGSYPAAAATIGRRIQCAAADVDPALNAGALYFGEGQYVAADDAKAGNKNNNASYRAMAFAAGTLSASFTASTVQQDPAILAWQANDASVVIEYVDWPNDGRFIIARKVTSLGGGNHHYEFAVHNLNSDRSGGGFAVGFPAGTTISNTGFKDIAYHSGEPYSGLDWAVSVTGSSVEWMTESFASNPNANALRWGTLYNFWFDATAAAETSKTILPFKCPTNPEIPSKHGYVLNTSAAYDDPAILVGTNGPSTTTNLSVPIGFSFSFYGKAYTTVYIAERGFLTFTPGGPGGGVNLNRVVPSSSVPNEAIFGYWDNSLNAAAGQIKYETQGVAPNRRFIVHWNNVPGLSGAENFKIILDETTNKITSTIIASAAGGSSATRGVEVFDGFSGVPGSFNTPGSAVAGTSWTYTPIVVIPWSVDLEISGSTAPFGVLTFSVNSNAPAGSPVELVASFDPGPTDFGVYGVLNVGFTPGLWVPLIDGGGAFGPPVPAHVTDSCGDLSVPITLTGDGIPPGLVINVQGGIVAPFSVPPPPNGLFHITEMVQIIT
jgi:hypothetical protein